MSLQPTPLTPELYEYLLAFGVREPEICRQLRLRIAKDKYYKMQSNPDSAQFLAFLLPLLSAKRCLEIGVYMGYATLWLALHLPDDGQVIACDVSDKWHSTAQEYWQRAGVSHKIDFRLGAALDTLEALEKSLENSENESAEDNKFDLIFIDADKENYLNYCKICLRLLRKGALLAFDNTLWGGDVARPEIKDAAVEGIRALNSYLAQNSDIDLTLLSIGDGLSLVRKKSL